MDKIIWCLKQKKGIKLVQPNKNISNSYIFRAESDLQNIKNQNNIWKVIVSYYACYNALYSVLIKYGLKCEIHDCSIALMQYFNYLKHWKKFMKNLKENRLNTQYYLEKPEAVNLTDIKKFVNFCKLELSEINKNKIENIRNKISKK